MILMSNMQIKKWFRWFKNSRSDTMSENVEHVEVVINENCRLTTLQNDIAIPKIIVYFWNFNSRFGNESRDCKICSTATWMQKYKDYQMLSKFHNPKIMKKIITDDETWIYDYDLKTKFQSLIWKTHNEARLKNIY